MQDKIVLEEYNECKELVTQIEDFKRDKGRYPKQLSEIETQKDCIYELSKDSSNYMIVDMFEHRKDRFYINSPTFALEAIIYDSETQTWTHDIP
jgi:hypothetical protein